jgi:hypothetical protein
MEPRLPFAKLAPQAYKARLEQQARQVNGWWVVLARRVLPERQARKVIPVPREHKAPACRALPVRRELPALPAFRSRHLD